MLRAVAFDLEITLVHGSTSRFRMRRVNIVGPSPFSQSSRVIQTLQAPPDVAPTSISVRTASETSLRLRWVVSWRLWGGSHWLRLPDLSGKIGLAVPHSGCLLHQSQSNC